MTQSHSTIFFRASLRAPWLASLTIALCALGATSPAAGATRTWQPQTTFVWSNPNNWAEGVAPVNGDDLVFPRILDTSSQITNDIPNLHVHSIQALTQLTVLGEPLFIGAGGFTGVPGNVGGIQRRNGTKRTTASV